MTGRCDERVEIPMTSCSGGILALALKKKFLPGVAIAAMSSWLAERINVTVCRHSFLNPRATNKGACEE
jgi:hypothetical protein